MDEASNAARLVMDVHILRRVRDQVQAGPGPAKPIGEVAELYRAAELRLRSISALELADALIKYRRVTGVPFKL